MFASSSSGWDMVGWVLNASVSRIVIGSSIESKDFSASLISSSPYLLTATMTESRGFYHALSVPMLKYLEDRLTCANGELASVGVGGAESISLPATCPEGSNGAALSVRALP